MLKHQSKVLELPERIVTEAEYKSCKAEAERLLKRAAETGDSSARGMGNWNARIAARYEKLAENPHPMFSTPVNVLRIGDAVICTNAFELYTDFGIQMKARSKANLTFVVQLANGGGTYLPSERAVKGGGYGAVIQSNTVGPEGGQVLVEETLKMVDGMW